MMSSKGFTAIHCLLCPFELDCKAMEKAEVKQIADYLKDLEEKLVKWDSRGTRRPEHIGTIRKHKQEHYGVL